ncbi:chromatin modification-related protein YNG2-like [Contarinia nasturtii]|uniref:chromatin modification-related protein YNG2-like n=1 Tax=Contarinia nasturtii TaxID=265458 RepID=UPI0012D3F60B|nr:chromatin modification-related protein YNG2-like [Contarinia nasturtii]
MALAKVAPGFKKVLDSLLDDTISIRCTRSITRFKNLLGIKKRQDVAPARISARRKTEGSLNPQRRSIRLRSLPVQRLAVVQENYDDPNKKWCVCRKPDDYTPMIQCDGPLCQIEWFHMNCIKMSIAPIGSWFCPNCQLN